MAAIKDAVQHFFSNHPDNQAAWIQEKGARLHVAKAEMPVPSAHEILIKNHAVAVNPVDWGIQDRGIFVTSWPQVLGCDVAGEVVAVGPDVTKFQLGDRVLAHTMSLVTQSPSHGAFAHYSLAFADRAAVLPAPVPFSAAAVLPLALSTAAEGLYLPREENFLGLPPPSLSPETGTKVLVLWGASSSVGATVLQLARASGVRVVGTASSRNHGLVRGWGASGVFDHGDGEVVRKVVEEVKGLGGEFVGVYDAISSVDGSYPPVLEIAKLLGGGKVVVVRAPPPADKVPEGVEVGAVFAGNRIRHTVWEEFVTPALEKGVLKCWPEPLIVGKGLGRVQEGLDTNKRGVSARKVVIELGE